MDVDEILAAHPREGAVHLIGMLLLGTQQAEHYLSFVLRVVFNEGTLTVDDFTRNDKKTLGRMISELRTHFDLDPSFDKLLRGFLEQRNTFVHTLGLQDEFDLKSKDGVNRLWQFLAAYRKNLEQVSNTFVAFSLKLAKDMGAPKGEEWQFITESGYLPHLKARYYPMLQKVVKKKKLKTG